MAIIATSSSPTCEQMTSSYQSLICHDPVANAKGQKNAIVTQTDGQPALWTLTSTVKPLFSPSSFNTTDNGRKSLCLSVPPDVMDEAVSLDTWAINYAQQHSERLFGKTLTLNQIKERYMGVVKTHDKYPAYLKVKIASDLRNQPLYWTPEKTRRGPPDDWIECELICQFKIAGFWFMSSSFGLSVQLANAQVAEVAPKVCPF
jgi:hypothetical protein